MDTSLIWTLCFVPSVSVLGRFDCTQKTGEAYAATPREIAYEAPFPTSERLSSIGGGGG